MPLPLTICVANYTDAKPMYCTKGNILPYVMASCAIPGVFEPITLEDKLLVDGGLFDNFPIETCDDKKIIGSHVNPRRFDKENPLKDFALKALDMLIARDITAQKEQCEIFFEPEKLVDI